MSHRKAELIFDQFVFSKKDFLRRSQLNVTVWVTQSPDLLDMQQFAT
jgi:hypothetical protein